jgi:hypothetical protein
MQLSDDTLHVIAVLEESAEGGLRKANDMAVILEVAATHDEVDLTMQLTRTGTGMWKVYSTLRRLQQGAEGYAQLEREFALQMNALREQLAQLMRHADDETLRRFDDLYFGMTQGVIRNLVDLSHDLARLKALQQG